MPGTAGRISQLLGRSIHDQGSIGSQRPPLVTAAALRLGGRGLLTSSIHNEVLKALASYDFANWGGPCARGGGNGCMDDYSVAAAGHAWAGASRCRPGIR